MVSSRLQHGERLVAVPLVQLRAVVPSDDEIGPFAVADLVVDDAPHDGGVVLVRGLEPALVDERDVAVGQRLDQLLERDLVLERDVHHGQWGAVVVRDEPPLPDLAERHRHQPVEAPTLFQAPPPRAGCPRAARGGSATRRPG